ncbi:MAG: DUF4159 domain-containing protein [Vicinamibacterales bacterium]
MRAVLGLGALSLRMGRGRLLLRHVQDGLRSSVGASRWGMAVAALLILGSVAAFAQFGVFGRGGGRGVRFAPAEWPDRNFTVCRIMYTSVRSEPNGGGWRTDYPGGETNLMIRLSELTKTSISVDGGKRPNVWVVRMTDPALFDCPYTVASDVGTIGITPPEAEQLRTYLLKGGFLWVDDFWGTPAWEQWSREFSKVLPPAEYPIEDIPLGDPIYHALFEVKKAPQITNIQFWRAVGGRETSERGSDSRDVHFRTIRDKSHRMMVVMTHNSDVADSWEREGEDAGFFYQYSPDGYAFGINVLLYAMSH